ACPPRPFSSAANNPPHLRRGLRRDGGSRPWLGQPTLVEEIEYGLTIAQLAHHDTCPAGWPRYCMTGCRFVLEPSSRAGVRSTHRWREIVWMPSAGQGRFWLGTVMPVAGLCLACSRGNAAGLDGLSASRSSHLDFALDAHPFAPGLPG